LNTYFLQGSVATDLRGGGSLFSSETVMAHFAEVIIKMKVNCFFEMQ